MLPRKQGSLPSNDATPSLHDSLIIHGDNLHALKALLPRYGGRVNCVYIDAPYNTGNENWLYNDNVNSPLMQEWLKDKGPVDGENLERHDKWLCMMWPRLHLLRELLAEDGVIFVSIDDNEVHHLRMMMDEIFGEENFVACVTWEKRYTRSNNAKMFTSVVDHLIAYRESIALRQRQTVEACQTNPKRSASSATPSAISTSTSPNYARLRAGFIFPWTNGQAERMNRTVKEATVKRFHYDRHDQLRNHLEAFVLAYNFARRLKTLQGLTPYEYICEVWTAEPQRFRIDPTHQIPGLNT